MPPASKRGEKRQFDPNNPSPSTSVSPSKKKPLCIICGGSANTNIEKDMNYDSMMQLYWSTVGVDAKPRTCNETDTCTKCFDSLVKFFEANDLVFYFENFAKQLRLKLLRKSLKGFNEWEKDGRHMHPLQMELKKKFGSISDQESTTAELEAISLALGKYQAKTTYVATDNADGPKKKISIRDSLLSKPGGNGEDSDADDDIN